MLSLSDGLLLRRFHEEGDQASFDALFMRHYGMVYGVLYRLVGSPQQAEDLAQEVFLKLAGRRLAHDDNVAGWLYRVAVNSGYNALRAEGRRFKREEQAARQAVIESGPPGVEEEAARRALQEDVRAALRRIPPRAAKLLVLRASGLSYAEVAAAAGVAPGSVGTLLARAERAFLQVYDQGSRHETR